VRKKGKRFLNQDLEGQKGGKEITSGREEEYLLSGSPLPELKGRLVQIEGGRSIARGEHRNGQ